MSIKSKVTSRNVGLSYFRSTTVDETLEQINDTETNVYSWNIINPNSSVCYVKFFDVDGGATLGTDAPIKTLMIPADGTVGATIKELPLFHAENRLEIAATGALADNDTTAITNDLVVDINYG